jgi:hypothetical protein
VGRRQHRGVVHGRGDGGRRRLLHRRALRPDDWHRRGGCGNGGRANRRATAARTGSGFNRSAARGTTSIVNSP